MFRTVRQPPVTHRVSRPLRAPCVPVRRSVGLTGAHQSYRENIEKIESLKIEHAHARAGDKSSFDVMMSGLVGQGILRACDFFVDLAPTWEPAYVFTGVLFASGAVANIFHTRDMYRYAEEIKAREEIRAEHERAMPGFNRRMIPGEDHPLMDLPARNQVKA